MEEKWWSKFQTKTENKPSEPVESCEQASKEVLDDAINFIQDLNVKIDQSMDQRNDQEGVQKWMQDMDELAKNAADYTCEKVEEFMNSPEVQEAASNAKQVMNDVVNEVKSWAEEPTKPNVEPVFDDNNEFKKDVDAIKQAVNDSLNRKEVVESIEFVKSKASDANKAVTSYLNKPEVVKTMDYLNDKVDHSKQWINETLEKEEVAEKLNYMKDKAEEAKQWVFEVYHSEDVQEGIEKAKESMDELAHNTRASARKVINDPRVQNGYVSAKKNTVKTARNMADGVKKGVNEFKSSDTLAKELVEWRDSATSFTRHSARLIGATANEIAHNEQVQYVANKSVEVASKFAKGAYATLKKWANKQNTNEVSTYIEFKEEHSDTQNDE